MPTLREILKNVNLLEVYDILFQKDKSIIENPPQDVSETKDMYEPVVGSLLDLPEYPPDMPIRIYWTLPYVYPENPKLNEPSYLDVELINTEYEGPPPPDLKPWGGEYNKKDDCPEGHFNVNWNGYIDSFGMGFTKRKDLIDSQISKPENVSWEEAIAVFLWELTFYGWTQEDQQAVLEEIKVREKEYKEAKKEGRIRIEEKSFCGRFDVAYIEPRIEEITGGD